MLRLAICQFRPTKGEYAKNVERIAGVLAEAAALQPRPQLVVFPETATSGYFVEGGVKEVAVTAGTLFRDLQTRHAAQALPPVDVAVGFYELFQNHYYNACLYATLGGAEPHVRHVHRKVFLPTYGVFDEERFVDRGQDGVRAFDTGWGGRAAILICEDAWHSLSATIAALEGAQLVLVPSASPARGTAVDEEGAHLPASMVRWERVVRGIAEEHGVFVVLANLVGFEGGKGFPGASAVMDPSGSLLVRGPLFDEGLVAADLDLDQITDARADSPLLADLQSALPILTKGLGKRETRDGRLSVKFDPAKGEAREPVSRIPSPASRPSVHVFRRAAGEPDPLAIDGELVRKWLVSFIKDEVVRRRGFQNGIVGVSGGVDSALTTILATEALGREHVTAVRMPYRTSSPESFAHAQLVIDQLGLAAQTVDISPAVDGYLSQVEQNGAVDPTRKGNVMARERMIVLFDLSAKLKALPIGTSNKSERLLGYFTWHADDTPPVNPLGDLFKSQVYALARHVGVPEAILAKPPTPDLVPGQQTEQDYGFTYRQADPVLYYLIRGLSPDAIVARGFDRALVEAVHARLDSTHWKRRLPTVAVLSGTAIGEFYLRPVDY